MSRGDLQDLILSAADQVLTIRFRKKADLTVQNAALKGDTEAVAQVVFGVPRTMVCSHRAEIDHFGYLSVFDVEDEHFKRIDMRTIDWAVIDGKLHKVK